MMRDKLSNAEVAWTFKRNTNTVEFAWILKDNTNNAEIASSLKKNIALRLKGNATSAEIPKVFVFFAPESKMLKTILPLSYAYRIFYMCE